MSTEDTVFYQFQSETKAEHFPEEPKESEELTPCNLLRFCKESKENIFCGFTFQSIFSFIYFTLLSLLFQFISFIFNLCSNLYISYL
jgi:hypothetical protein